MNKIHSRSFDANLVRVFLSIWQTRSLTVSAERLALTQSAVSHALKRLRERFRDPLFVRTPQGMVPTDMAGRLFGPFSEAFHILERVVQEAGGFDASSSRRVFRLAMSDVAESVFFPALVRFCAIRAPGIRLEIIPLDVEEVARSLKLGEVDIAVGYLPALGSDFVSHDLFHDDLTCLLGEGHPPVEAGLSPGEFANLRHIDAGVNAPGHKMVDEMLHAMGMRRNVFVRTTRLSNAPPMLEKTDLAVIFPKILIRKFYRDSAFRQVAIPIELMPVEICAHYHCHYKNDSSILWMVEAISLIAADVNGS